MCASWCYIVLFLYLSNIEELRFYEIIAPCTILTICGIVLFVTLKKVLRSDVKAAAVSIFTGLYFTNTGLVLKYIKSINHTAYRYIYTLPIAIVVYLLLLFLIYKKFAEVFVQVVPVVLVSLLAVNVISAGVRVVTNDKETATTQTVSDDTNLAVETEVGSNIYLIVCDEYAGPTQLEKEFGYKNEAFHNHLKENGFNISYNSRNDARKTMVVMANLMQLGYVCNENTSELEIGRLAREGRLYSILQDAGYTVTGIGRTEWFGVTGSASGDGVGAQTEDGLSFGELVLMNSILGPVFDSVTWRKSKDVTMTFDELDKLDLQPNSLQFVFSYVCAPHSPYYLKSNGELNPQELWHNDDGTNSESYMGYLEYVNSRLIQATDRIIEHDPEAIIVLCSDHGDRHGVKSGQLQYNILNCVYYKGEKRDDIIDLSSVNTMIYILNHELNTELEFQDIPSK